MPAVDRARRRPRQIGALLLCTLVAGAACSPGPSPSPAASQGVVATPAGSPASAPSPSSAAAVPTSSPTPSRGPTSAPSPSGPPAAELKAGQLAVTVTDSVRVRSKPRVASDSQMYTPVLPTGTTLMIAGGPVVASGYTWVQVSVLSATLDGGVDGGWVAVADHDGTPWVALAPDATPGYELASATVGRTSGTLSAARLEATQANAFGIALYRKLLASQTIASTKGMVFSPTSIVDALAMARAGAAGTTAAQMDAVLHTSGWSQLSLGIASLDQQLASRNGVWTDQNDQVHALSLRLANTVFAQQGFPIESAYLSRMGETFGAGIALVDFVADTQGAIDAINGWVKNQTVGRIPVIVSKKTITPATRLALVNAIYLKANWAQEFSAGDTRSQPFTLLGGKTVTVPMMRQWGGQSIGLATGPGWKATELFYQGVAGAPLEMTLILPDNLLTFEQSMTATTLTTIQSRIAAEEARISHITPSRQDPMCSTYAYQVQLGLPRFGVDTGAQLAALLGQMGMKAAMTAGQADFSGINPDAPLFIGQVIHKATIDVDEKGTTAAAATVVGMDTTGGCGPAQPLKTISLTFNHPFLFLIRDVKTGAILFIGRVTDPTQR